MTVQDLVKAIGAYAHSNFQSQSEKDKIEQCLKQGIDPFELYIRGDEYTSALEDACILGNTSLIIMLLKPYISNKELLIKKLGQRTENFDDLAINIEGTQRTSLTFMQMIVINNTSETLQAVLSLIEEGSSEEQIKANRKAIYKQINQPINYFAITDGEKLDDSESFPEHLILRATIPSLMNDSHCSIDYDSYKDGKEQSVLKYLRQKRYYDPRYSKVKPVLPSEPLVLTFDSRLGVFNLLMSYNLIDLNTSTSDRGRPFFDLLRGIVAMTKDQESWDVLVNKMVIGNSECKGYIREDGLPVIKVKGLCNIFGQLPDDVELICRNYKMLLTAVREHLKSKTGEIAVLQSRMERHSNELADIKSELSELAAKMDKAAIVALKAAVNTATFTHSGSESSLGSSSSKSSKSVGTPTSSKRESDPSKSIVTFYNELRDSFLEDLGSATSKKGRGMFFENTPLKLAFLSLSYGLSYSIPVPGIQGVVAAPIQFLGEKLQEKLADGKAEHLKITLRDRDQSIEAQQKLAIITALGVASRLQSTVHIFAENGELDALIASVQKKAVEGIKKLVNEKKLVDEKTTPVDPQKFVQDYIVEAVELEFKKKGPSRDAKCTVS